MKKHNQLKEVDLFSLFSRTNRIYNETTIGMCRILYNDILDCIWGEIKRIGKLEEILKNELEHEET